MRVASRYFKGPELLVDLQVCDGAAFRFMPPCFLGMLCTGII